MQWCHGGLICYTSSSSSLLNFIVLVVHCVFLPWYGLCGVSIIQKWGGGWVAPSSEGWMKLTYPLLWMTMKGVVVVRIVVVMMFMREWEEEKERVGCRWGYPFYVVTMSV